jgi:integrase/recombinase XerD
VCPETGRARLSCRRAEEIFEENTRLPADPLASPDDIEDLTAGRSTGSATVP